MLVSMSVLIGLVDQDILLTETVGWDENRIGGLPVWINSKAAVIPECINCGQSLTLVSQLYCPLGGSAHHRCIYVFVCPGPCSRKQDGWRIFRAMKYDKSYKQAQQTPHQQQQNIQKEVWTNEQDDWGIESDDWSEGLNVNDGSEGSKGDVCCGSSDDTKQRLAASGICHDSQIDEKSFDGVVTESNFHSDLECFKQLGISDSAEQPLNSNTEYTVTGEGGDMGSGHVMEEDIGLADKERWNAMAQLLNTKQEQTADSRAIERASLIFKSYYLCVVDEPEDCIEISGHVADLIKDYERLEGVQLASLTCERPKSSKGGAGPVETYEKTELKHGDRIFHKFLKRLQRSPHQCIRYDRNGQPLLVNKMDGQTAIASCPYCGGERVFELQLLPPLIAWLRTDEGTEIDFGTILVYTCKNNCWPMDHDPACNLDFLEEFSIFQADPDHHLYR